MMSAHSRAWFLSLFVALLISAVVDAQESMPLHVVVSNQIVEISEDADTGVADFRTISVRYGGKSVKRFAVPLGATKSIVATYENYDGDYVLLRTREGQEACGSGDLFVLKFYTYGGAEQVGLDVSPKLTTCLGEYPPVKFSYDRNGLVISVSGYVLRGKTWRGWAREQKSNRVRK